MKGSEQQQRDRLFIADSIEAKKTERGEERLAPEKKKSTFNINSRACTNK